MNEWISVKDRMPPLDTPVLAGDNISYQVFMYTNCPIDGEPNYVWSVCYDRFDYHYAQGKYAEFIWDDDYEDSITHWMPLPQPPKGDE